MITGLGGGKRERREIERISSRTLRRSGGSGEQGNGEGKFSNREKGLGKMGGGSRGGG